MTVISTINFPKIAHSANLVAGGNVIVQKFGGTSVGSIARIRDVAARAIAEHAAGKRVVVVVSAMAGETNRLLALAEQISTRADLAERDVLAATGEQASAALTAMAIRAAGGKARSFLGSQLRILTDSSSGDARVRHVETARLLETLDAGEIPVVAGFQGVDCEGRITTLGRGGSDTTAVAIAAELGAGCDIYTDVDGVYTADPSVCPTARKLPAISYRQMLTLASLGAKVLHGRSVALAEKYEVPLRVRSSFADVEGTLVRAGVDALEGARVTSLACDKNLILVETVDAEGLLARGIPVDSIANGTAIVRATDAPRLPAGSLVARIARVSLVGYGLHTEPAILAKVARLLRDFTPRSLQASETAITVILEITQTEAAMKILHDGFELAKRGEA